MATVALAVRGEPGYPLGGGIFAAPDGIGKGATYIADVYTPRPSERQLRGAGFERRNAQRQRPGGRQRVSDGGAEIYASGYSGNFRHSASTSLRTIVSAASSSGVASARAMNPAI